MTVFIFHTLFSKNRLHSRTISPDRSLENRAVLIAIAALWHNHFDSFAN